MRNWRTFCSSSASWEPNINQLAKVANANGDLSHVRNIRELKATLEEIRDEVWAALTP